VDLLQHARNLDKKPVDLLLCTNRNAQTAKTSVLLASEPDNDATIFGQTLIDLQRYGIAGLAGALIEHLYKQEIARRSASETTHARYFWQLSEKTLSLCKDLLPVLVHDGKTSRLQSVLREL
jgi:hypothetical protein